MPIEGARWDTYSVEVHVGVLHLRETCSRESRYGGAERHRLVGEGDVSMSRDEEKSRGERGV